MTHRRSCKRDRMLMFLPLGSHPPANTFLRADQLGTPEPSFPLDTYVCLNCGLVQIPNKIPADFFRHYLYVPSVSASLHEHFAGLVKTVKDRFFGASDALLSMTARNRSLEEPRFGSSRPPGSQPISFSTS